jgi:hypothetical protein
VAATTVVVMDITGSMMKQSDKRFIGATVLSLAVGFCSSTALAETEYTASVVLGVTHTDNVFLDPPPNEIDDLVFRATPSVGLTHTSQHLDADLAYTYEWYKYNDLDVDNSYNLFDGSVTGHVMDDSLTLEVGAMRTQVVEQLDQDIAPGR